MIAGDGPDREALERLGYGRFLGPLPRQKVLELFRAGDASLLSSSWENFPHTVVEALAVGTPVIATRTGGVAEVLEDGVNGLVVEPGDVEALTAAIERFFPDPALAGRPDGQRRRIGRRLRSRPCLRAAGADPDRGGRMTPRVLFVARDPYRLPLGAEPRAQVGRALGADEPARARERHRLRPALRAPAADAARRAALLRLAAGPDRARAAAPSGPTS